MPGHVMRAAVVAALLSSCGLYPEPQPDPPPQGLTLCGVAGPHDSAAMAAEGNALIAFRAIWEPHAACAALAGWSVEVVGGNWHDGDLLVAGDTNCDLRVMRIDSTDWGHNAYAHELAHALDCPATEPDHASWPSRGIPEAINAAQAPMR